MGTKEKLINRFCKQPIDFTYEETLKLLATFGYCDATSGSRVRFKNKQTDTLIFTSHIPAVL